MNLPRAVEALRALRRGHKVLLVLIAAWAPLVLARIPVLAALIVALATALFFLSVSPTALPGTSHSSALGVHDEES